MVLRRSDGSAAKGKDARSRGVPGNRPESVSNVHRGECDPAVAGLSTEDLREVLSACTRALESADNVARGPKTADLAVTRQSIAQARQRINKLWRLVE